MIEKVRRVSVIYVVGGPNTDNPHNTNNGEIQLSLYIGRSVSRTVLSKE
jgi:hypothetical protein